jgi:hypothetical protein
VADTAQLPIWAVYAVGFGTPASAFVGVMLTGLLGRRSAAEIERRSRREEVMRLMRWSAEMAIDADERKRQLGAQQLTVLADSELLGMPEKPLVDAALESALAEAVDVIQTAGILAAGYDLHGHAKEGGCDG